MSDQDGPLVSGSVRVVADEPIAAIVIYWNTARLGEAVARRRHAGLPVIPEFLPHISPLGWAHILLTGEYRWQKR